MRIVKNILVGLAVLACAWGLSAPASASTPTPPATGLTITPATLTLELVKGQQQASANFTLTNNYDTILPLHFSFQQAKNNVANADPTKQLSLSQADVSLAPHTSFVQTLTLTDSSQLAPGSQFVDLLVSQVATQDQRLNANAAIRMPLVIIKDDGAVRSMAASGFSAEGVHTSVPQSLGVTIKNTGNVVVIPRGSVSIRDNSGKEVGKGILNPTSQAVAPGASLRFATPILAIAPATVLGSYHAVLQYGLGGDQATQSVQGSFVYIGWRHIIASVIVASLVALGIYVILHMRPKLTKKPDKRPAKRGAS